LRAMNWNASWSVSAQLKSPPGCAGGNPGRPVRPLRNQLQMAMPADESCSAAWRGVRRGQYGRFPSTSVRQRRPWPGTSQLIRSFNSPLVACELPQIPAVSHYGMHERGVLRTRHAEHPCSSSRGCGSPLQRSVRGRELLNQRIHVRRGEAGVVHRGANEIRHRGRQPTGASIRLHHPARAHHSAH
jgi:hypothetical protein